MPILKEKKFRLLPILIGVCALSFIVHVFGFIDNVNAMDSGEKAKEPEVVEGIKIVKEKPKDNSKEEDKPSIALTPTKRPSQGWRDAIDVDIGGSATKKAITQDLVARSAELDKRQKDLELREAILKAASESLETKYENLKMLEAQLNGAEQEGDAAHQTQIERLVKIYEGMKPKDAARLFDGQDMDLLVDVMSQMSERKLSPIMAAMNPDRARTLTVMLSEATPVPTEKSVK